jgi:hypothetical protein
LENTRKNVQYADKELSEASILLKKTKEQILIEHILKTTPNGNTKLDVTWYGFILINENLSFQDESENHTSNGMQTTIRIKTDDENVVYVPVIISKTHTQSVVGHEKQHVFNLLIMEALKRVEGAEALYWGDNPEKSDLLEETTVKIWAENGLPMEQTQAIRESLIKYALYHAKNELIADMYSIQNDPKSHYEYMLKVGGAYDYLRHHFAIGPEKQISEEYVAKLKAQAEIAVGIADTYKSNKGWETRYEIFKFVLQNIPMSKWNKFLTEGGFVEEIEKFQSVKEIYIDGELTKVMNFDLSNTEIELSISLEYCYAKFQKTLREKSAHPALGLITEYETRMKKIHEKITQTAQYKIVQSYEKFKNTCARISKAQLPEEKIGTSNKIYDLQTEMRDVLLNTSKEHAANVIATYINRVLELEKL